MKKNKPDTLCWSCGKAVGGCSWSRTFTPVPGWEAEKTYLKPSANVDTPVESYLVISCPEYGPERQARRVSQRGIEDLAQAILAKAARDYATALCAGESDRLFEIEDFAGSYLAGACPGNLPAILQRLRRLKPQFEAAAADAWQQGEQEFDCPVCGTEVRIRKGAAHCCKCNMRCSMAVKGEDVHDDEQ